MIVLVAMLFPPSVLTGCLLFACLSLFLSFSPFFPFASSKPELQFPYHSSCNDFCQNVMNFLEMKNLQKNNKEKVSI